VVEPRVIEDAEIERAARELVERYGDQAVTVAGDRVKTLSASTDRRAHDAALRVLSVLERLVAEEERSST